ncbi:uncharacterized protein PGRI_020230 [Penicillium griseofulvum]|uniref:Peptidase S33 tripeptidyl aminopeptidase-like, C-terminal n=1 Tax=Penicillium patulum TaxID=5078 RepID=A0A135LGT5_PENPA|nr:uncharacterized protein PGRI_020230 [Penicillium griseofulvum]KXG48153.1 hypothetical protein PGRI_020230 [Penicillium griseofulvum]
MDWNSTDKDAAKVALAIIKLPAVVPVTDPRYGGTILVNPGGPGASGVNMILGQGRRLQKIVDSQAMPISVQQNFKGPQTVDDKYYDIVGFDPRGINNTTPRYQCFTDPHSRQRWSLANEFLDLLGSSTVATEQAWGRAMALSATCTRKDGPEIGQFMNTTPTAADILEIIERLGEWRENAAEAIIASKPTVPEIQRQRIRDATRWRKGAELLQYWGFSYGTVLGATFAAMYPHRVKRVVLDGVCDSQSMYSGYWTANVLDTDKIIDMFFEICHQAGPEKCSFAIGNNVEGMRDTLDKTLTSLNETPLAVPGSDTRGPDIITYSDLMRFIKDSVYEPLTKFPLLADVLADVSHGNGSILADLKSEHKVPICSGDNTQNGLKACPAYEETFLETLASIGCTDGEDRSGLTKQDFFDYYKVLKGQSRWMADIWASFTMPCWGWKTRPKWRYEGPISGSPAHPILWIGNTMDPATPLRNAYKMAERFSGSAVLEQESAGHCTYSADSKCTAENIRRYFHTGILPGEGTRCDADKMPFGV